MNYESWRISYQSSEQAARHAFDYACTMAQQRDELLAACMEIDNLDPHNSPTTDWLVALKRVKTAIAHALGEEQE